MLNAKKLLTKMLMSTTKETLSLGTISANGYLNSNQTITRAGYRPIGIAGYQITSSYVFASQIELRDATVGSGKIYYEVRNMANGSATVSLNVTVLWRPA